MARFSLEDVKIDPEVPLDEALCHMDVAGTGALVVASSDGTMSGILTDGDVRRAVLRGISLQDPCGLVANRHPIYAQAPVAGGEALFVMDRHDINHLPVVDANGALVDFLLRRDLIAEDVIEESRAKRLHTVVISPSLSIAEAISALDAAGTGGLALCSQEGFLVGLLTDGDIRRAILRSVPLDQTCASIATRNPIVARGHVSPADALRIMVENDISHLPVQDEDGRLTAFLLRRDLVQAGPTDVCAVIMAGGFGKRLLPLTENTPKPMLPVGDKPLLERTIRQLRRSGIRNVQVTTHYLPESIMGYFGDGREYGVKMSYAKEDQPLGTAGGLKMLQRPQSAFLVINGDILTGVSFDNMLSYHRKYEADLTVGVRNHQIEVPFGVVDCEDVWITQLREKPMVNLLINAGVYLLEPTAYDYIPDGVRFDMTDLIKLLLAEGRRVVSFPVIEYWQDVGRLEDYRRADDDAEQGRI